MAKAAFPLRKFLLIVAALALVLVVAAGNAAYWYLGPFQAFGDETFVEIDRGMSSRAIARELTRQGLVRTELAFLFVRLIHPTAKLQAGEYRFGSVQTPWQVFDKIRRGEVFYQEVTVPEGSNVFDIAGLLAKSGIVSTDAFLKASAHAESIHDLDPSARSLEGYLFPSTYRVTHHSTANQLCRMMTAEFRKQWQLLAGSDRSGSDHSQEIHKIVTLASLVEKETGLAEERPLVASVFLNRLHRNMPLQCDPTTVYAALLGRRYRGVIHKSDLASSNPYNTYTHAGLPPGPITNPGAASLRAAMQPSQAPYLYFVAKPDASGSHQFSATLDEHEKAVLAYRKHDRASGMDRH